MSKAASEVRKSADDIAAKTSILLKKWDKAALGVIIQRYGTTINSLDAMIQAKEADIAQYVEKIGETKEVVSELTNNSTHEREVGKLTKHMQDLNKKEVALLKQTRDILSKQQMSLLEISKKDDGAALEAFKTIRDSTAASLKSIQEKIAAFEAEGSSLADINPA